MKTVSVIPNERKRYVMHISSPEGHMLFVSPLTNESPMKVLKRLFGTDDEIEIKEDGIQGDGFFARIEPLAEYVEKLPAGEDRDYFERELAKPEWKDNKIGRIMYKVLCGLRVIRIC